MCSMAGWRTTAPVVSLPTLVIVSGPPGAGKTTLAHRLAQAIGCPAVCRDEIKEGLLHAHDGGFEPGVGDALTQRALPLFFDVVRLLLAAKVTVVAEAAFQDPLWRRGLEPLSGLAQVRVVHCTVAADVSFARAVERDAEDAARRAAHGVSAALLGLEGWRERVAAFERLSLAVPSLEVDTTDGYEPDLREIVAFVNRPPAGANPGRG